MVRRLSITIIGETLVLKRLYSQVEQSIGGNEYVELIFESPLRLKVLMADMGSAYQFLIKKCEEYGLHPFIAQRVEHTKEEIENSAFFSMSLSYPLELEGTSAASYGTQYKGTCPQCGLGGVLESDVLVDRKFVKAKKIGRLIPDVFVSSEIKEIVTENRLTGVSFDAMVKDYKGRDIPELYVMKIHNVLPCMNPTTWLLEKKVCQTCGRISSYLRSDIQYKQAALKGANDFNLTQEYIMGYSEQEIVVSAKVRSVFKRNRIYAGFLPVTLL